VITPPLPPMREMEKELAEGKRFGRYHYHGFFALGTLAGK